MCRLLACAARTPTSVVDLLGDSLASFAALSRQHPDGWGLAWYDDSGGVRVEKEARPAYRSPGFERLCHEVHSDAFAVHLRWATPGMAVVTENCHPFTDGADAFAHNGVIKPVAVLDDLVRPRRQAAIQGTTDSERYFLALQSALASASFEVAVPKLLRTIAERCTYTSLNFVLLTERMLFAVCAYAPDALRAERDPELFTLRYRVTDDAVVVGSTGWEQLHPPDRLTNGQALAVERKTLRTEIVDLW